jgi:hypothetical protein
VNSAEGCPRRNSSGCFAAIRATCPSASGLRGVRRAGGLDRDRDFSGNSAGRVKREGADVHEGGTRVWVPPVGPSCVHEARSVGRVPRSAQHAGVGGVERRATIEERQDVVERQVTRWMGRMLGTIAWAHVAVLADVAGDHPLGQAGPSRVRVDVMVGTNARQPRVLAAPTLWSACDNAADRAQLHRRRAGNLVAGLTLVTLDCRPFDITRIVSRGRASGPYAYGATPWGPTRLTTP